MGKGIISVLDIGSTKICCLICQLDVQGRLEILGVGIQKAGALRKGIVVNFDEAIEVVQNVVEEAELMAGIVVKELCVGLSGEQIEGINSRGVVAINSKNNEITEEDITRAINLARSVQLANDREILHVIPQEFIVDSQRGVANPMGMSGVRLESEVYLVSTPKNAMLNVKRVVEKAGYRVDDVVLQSIASAEAVLNDDEKELGVILLDIGGGTTDILIYKSNAIWHSAVIPYGGDQISKDVAYGLKTTQHLAGEIKEKYGSASSLMVDSEDFFRAPLIGDKIAKVSRRALASIIEPRVEEIFEMAKNTIVKGEYLNKAVAGVVLTGGGALCKDITDAAEKVFSKPARIGMPNYLSGLSERVASPIFSTVVGLAKYKSTTIDIDENISAHNENESVVSNIKSAIKRIFN